MRNLLDMTGETVGLVEGGGDRSWQKFYKPRIRSFIGCTRILCERRVHHRRSRRRSTTVLGQGPERAVADINCWGRVCEHGEVVLDPPYGTWGLLLAERAAAETIEPKGPRGGSVFFGWLVKILPILSVSWGLRINLPTGTLHSEQPGLLRYQDPRSDLRQADPLNLRHLPSGPWHTSKGRRSGHQLANSSLPLRSKPLL